MQADRMDDRYAELCEDVNQVASAWILAGILVTLLLTVVAPFLVT